MEKELDKLCDVEPKILAGGVSNNIMLDECWLETLEIDLLIKNKIYLNISIIILNLD